MQTTQEERTLAGLVHLGVVFSWFGLAFQVVILAIYLPKSRYIASHAKQAIGMWVTWVLVRVVLGLITGSAIGLSFAFNPWGMLHGGAIGSIVLWMLLRVALFFGVLALAIIGMVAGFSGKLHRYPLIGDLIASITGE